MASASNERQASTVALPDDVLMEILLRLPDARSVIKSAAVCKRWQSLVHSNPSSDYFIRQFVQLRRDSQSQDNPTAGNSTLFNCTRRTERPAFHELHSNETKPCDLSFVPDSEGLAIRASTGDLLLLSRGERQYYICNFLTRRWFALPEFPLTVRFAEFRRRGGCWGFALVCRPGDDDDGGGGGSHHQVILVCNTDFIYEGFKIYLTFFDSSIGEWVQNKLACGYRTVPEKVYGTHLQVVQTSGGTLHWLEGAERIYGLAALDTSNSGLRLVNLPSSAFQNIPPRRAKASACLGTVRGRLRLCLMSETNRRSGRFRLRIWELEGGDSWTLARDCLFGLGTAAARPFLVLCLDPDDEDAVFFVRGKHIRRYQISEEKDVKICEFPCSGQSAKDLTVLPLAHPFWPTSISLLASATDRAFQQKRRFLTIC